jgi:hypothetical protein
VRLRWRPPVVAGGLCLVLGCAPAADEQVLTRFFEVSRTLDSTRLDRVATAVFNPRTDGSVQRFSVTDRSPEQRQPIGDSNRETAVRSLAASSHQVVDLSTADFYLSERRITLEADVRAPDGTVAPGVLIVTVARAVGTAAASTLEGQWIVTRLQRARGERTSPAASSGPPS